MGGDIGTEEMTRPPTVEGRRRIHEDLKKENEVICLCGKCKKRFLIQGETHTSLNEEELNKCKKLYPDLAQIADPFTCNLCESTKRSFFQEMKKATEETLKGLSVPKFMSNIYFQIIFGMITGIGIYLSLSNPHVHYVKIYRTLSFDVDEKIDMRKSFDVNVHEQTLAEDIFDNEIDGLEKLYTKQEEVLWYTLLGGIKSVLRENPNKPSVFLMLFSDDTAGQTAKCLAQDVSKSATKFLLKKLKTPVMISGTDLDRIDLKNDPGLLLVKYNDTVRERGVMVVTDLQNVPPSVATSFHFFCDRYSPLVEKAVFFFTLKMDKLPNKRKEIQLATEERLKELWEKSMQESLLHPLITRLTPNIIRIFSDISSC